MEEKHIMAVKIYPSHYKDVKAITMENDRIKVQFLPEFGGKMTSFIFKENEKEFLAQAENTKYRRLNYDGVYVDAECSGFDDMFPTIDRVFYPNDPWKGVEMPDHGEVCAIRWEHEIKDDSLCMRTHGLRLPYVLEKRVRFDDASNLRIDYQATNLCDYDIDFIWAAHPIVNIEEGGEIILPYKDGAAATCVFSFEEGFGRYGDAVRWPVALRRDGKTQMLNKTAPKDINGNNYKIYFDERIPEGWCAYKYPPVDSRNSESVVFYMTFPAEFVPYFSIWMNEGSFHGFHSIAMEPCTGAYDRIDLAILHKKNSVLKAKSKYAWFLGFHIESYEEFIKRKEDADC
jgi:hypothetical protein